MRLPLIIALALVGINLDACATMPQQGVQINPSQVECLPLVAYTPSQESSIGDAEKSLPQDSPLRRLLDDYLRMRDADRACLASRATGG